MTKIMLDSFSAGPTMTRSMAYEKFREAVLSAGKFSCFEASESAPLYHQLCRDPEVETFDLGYPWTGVRRREVSGNPE